MLQRHRPMVLSIIKLGGLLIVILVAPLLAWIILLPYFLGHMADDQRQRLQRWITILLCGMVVFFGTPIIQLFPYALARPLAKFQITTLHRWARSLTDLSMPLQPLVNAVSPADRAAAADILRQSGTGIARLGGPYPWATSFYDFLQNRSDGDRHIRLNAGQFEVGFAGRDAGLFVDLETDDLTAIDRVHPRIQALTTLAPPSLEAYDRAAAVEAAEQTTIDGAFYDRTIPAKLGTVYALRSVMPSDGRDILVVLKVVRQDSDGSMIVVWKLLADFSGR